jgi:lysophospholipase L1-like esterase
MKRYIIIIISISINILFFVLTIRHFVNQPKKDDQVKTIKYWLHRDEVFTKLPVDTGSVVFVGDSHTQQFELAELFHSIKVKNRGINYDTSMRIIKRLNTITNLKPSKVFIEIGVNDLNIGLSEKQVSLDINNIILRIKAQSPLTRIYLESVLPTKSLLVKIKNLNKLLAPIAQADKITFINLDPYFADNGLKNQYDSGDGIHLNGEGYLKWRDVLVKYLND